MTITIVTLFPDMLSAFFRDSIIKRAQDKKQVTINLVNLRDYAVDSYGSVDDRPYGGGAGMVLRVEPIDKALAHLAVTKGSPQTRILLTSAKGVPFRQDMAGELSTLDHVVIIAGHYEGYDERIADLIDTEISLGDFIMTGGEIPAAAITDAIVRLLPGVLKKDDATKAESFFRVTVSDLIRAVGPHPVLSRLSEMKQETVQLLEYPHYTRPEIYKDKRVPDTLKSGNHRDIGEWRLREAFAQTLAKRPDLLDPSSP